MWSICDITRCESYVILPHVIHMWYYHMWFMCDITTCPSYVILPHVIHMWYYHMSHICDITTCDSYVILPHVIRMWYYHMSHICDITTRDSCDITTCHSYVILPHVTHMWCYHMSHICDITTCHTYVILPHVTHMWYYHMSHICDITTCNITTCDITTCDHRFFSTRDVHTHLPNGDVTWCKRTSQKRRRIGREWSKTEEKWERYLRTWRCRCQTLGTCEQTTPTRSTRGKLPLLQHSRATGCNWGEKTIRSVRDWSHGESPARTDISSRGLTYAMRRIIWIENTDCN